MTARGCTVAASTPPCPVCGMVYADFRGWYPGGFKGPLSGHKRGAWEQHVENCQDYTADALSFEVVAAPTVARDASGVRDLGTCILDAGTRQAVAYAPEWCVADDWGAEATEADAATLAFEADWTARETLARELLGSDYERAVA